MFPESAHSKGGQVMAAKQKKIALDNYLLNPNLCLYCNNIILPKQNQKIAYVRRKKFCNRSCSAKHNNVFFPKRIKVKNNSIVKTMRTIDVNRTKENIFNNSSSWQSGRSFIQKHARKVYFSYDLEPTCSKCGYSRHVEIAHIKSVASFPSEATLGEMNSINNLIALCPTHHWEFDNALT